MKVNSINPDLEDLPFSIHHMLGVPESEELVIEVVSGGTAAVSLRVFSQAQPDQRAFIKTVSKGITSGPHLNLGVREVKFYQLIESLNPDPYPNIPRCLNSYLAPDGSTYFLILEDLSESHQNHEALDFSDVNHWKTGLRALAEFHGRFTHTLTGTQIETFADDEQDVEAYLERLEAAYLQFRDDHQDCVDRSTLALLARCIPLIREFELEKARRVRENEVTTVLHRDAHLKNFLYPKAGNASTLIVDWQFWGVGIGTFDLRHLLGSTLSHDLRDRQEELVHYYYRKYMEGANCDYAWEDCWSDYCKGIVDNLFMPLWQYAGFGWGFDRWGKTLKAAIENYYALKCDQFFVK